MGCDGGTIPTRGEMVRTKKKPEQISKEVDLSAKWRHCAISQEPLQPPIVACQMGRLYNKDAVIEMLLDRSKMESVAKFDHIKSLKDVKELKLTVNPAHTGASGKAGLLGNDVPVSPFICPITGLEMNGRYKFCYLLSCACVFSDRTLKQLREQSACTTCGKAFTTDDVIVINGTEEEMDELRMRMERRRQQSRKSKRSKVETTVAAVKKDSEDNSSGAGDSKQSQGPTTKQETGPGPSGNQVSCAMLSSGECSKMLPGDGSVSDDSADTAKLSATGPDDGPPKKKYKLETASNPKLVSSSSSVGHSKSTSDKGKDKKPASIQNDPKASLTYKSLFSSHPTARNQSKAHWVTYNPFYN